MEHTSGAAIIPDVIAVSECLANVGVMQAFKAVDGYNVVL